MGAGIEVGVAVAAATEAAAVGVAVPVPHPAISRLRPAASSPRLDTQENRAAAFRVVAIDRSPSRPTRIAHWVVPEELIVGGHGPLGRVGSARATDGTGAPAGPPWRDGCCDIVIGVIPTPASSLTCPTRPVQGAATSAYVCNLPGPEVLAIFKAASGAFVELNVFSSATLTDAQIDGLVAAAFGRM